ncbi:hypothetical protein CAL12_23055 [Bordetella genomosp. 8]|uniref:Uncharacterized protein n=1 Tax=Bordetella genomosp. 8 TaxID=1416806 RepID=A0A1W6YQN7_9BORD|nr:hypothetical protein [Bordetella genomosp. 8]ARP83410.1 hypothetical protein CAL12_23055 [Bordetella genomosp. 8]
MNELFKGLIGAELTLLGVSNQALPQSVASEPARALPRTEPRGARPAESIQRVESTVDGKAAVEFNESHYRIAAG